MFLRLLQKLRAVEDWQRTLYIMFVAQLLTAVGFSVIFPFLSLYVTELGSSSSLSVEFLAGAVFSAQALTMMIASPIWGAVADRYGRKLMVQRAMFGGAVIMLLMGFARTGEELVLLRALQGLITGTVAASNALVASVAPRRRSGYAMGLLLMGQTTGIAIGPLIGGVLADAFGYQLTFVVTSVLLLVGGILVFFGVEERFTPRPESATVKRSDVTIKVTETGELRARDQVTISAANDKQILWLAPEGTWVEEGDTLVVYESEKYLIAKSEAESTVEVARANIISALSELESQKAKEEAALKRYETMKNLADEGFAVQSEVDQARLVYRSEKQNALVRGLCRCGTRQHEPCGKNAGSAGSQIA